MAKKEKIIVITAKTIAGKDKLSYHGDKWILRGEIPVVKFSREPGPYYILMSKDGKKVIHVKKDLDPDFNTRELG